MKSFYACIDASLPAPQPLQHLAIRDRAAKAGGAITFYGAEEILTLGSQAFIQAKLRRYPGIQGVVFFTINQFAYGPAFNFKLLKTIVATLNLEAHFAREGLAIRDAAALDALFPFLYAVDAARRRDADRSWRALILQAATARTTDTSS